MTMTPQGRTATLSALVAAEIRAQMGRLEVRQAELARRMGENDTWVHTRLKGRTPIDLNDLHRFAQALGVGVHELLPPPDVAAGASVSVRNPPVTEWPPSSRRRRTRGREDATTPRPNDRRPPAGPRRTSRLPRPEAA